MLTLNLYSGDDAHLGGAEQIMMMLTMNMMIMNESLNLLVK